MNLTLKLPVTKAEITSELQILRNEVAIRKNEINLLSAAIQHYIKQCDHKGQKTGWNERDGSWGNPCPTCGYSY